MYLEIATRKIRTPCRQRDRGWSPRAAIRGLDVGRRKSMLKRVRPLVGTDAASAENIISRDRHHPACPHQPTWTRRRCTLVS
jgi:hypothetical protein